MKSLLSIFFFVTLVITGCESSLLTEAEGPEAANQAALTEEGQAILAAEGNAAGKSVKYVPFKGDLILTILTGTDEQDEADLGVECEAGEFEIFDRWHGNATHLGSFTGVSNGCFDTEAVTVNGIVGHFYAANGDQIHLEVEGRTDPLGAPFEPGVTVIWEFTVTGGTGRFLNASTPPGEPIVGIAGFDLAFEATGRISSVGSSK